MTTCKRYSFLLITGLVLLISLPVQSQFITIGRKIKSMRTSTTDVATVIIDAGTFRVYQAVIDTLTSDPKIEVTRRDNSERFVEFKHGTNTVSMKVDSLANGISQITVSAAHSTNAPKQTTDMAVDAIIRVCDKVGIKCTPDKQK
jgi:hypothetical protein